MGLTQSTSNLTTGVNDIVTDYDDQTITTSDTTTNTGSNDIGTIDIGLTSE